MKVSGSASPSVAEELIATLNGLEGEKLAKLATLPTLAVPGDWTAASPAWVEESCTVTPVIWKFKKFMNAGASCTVWPGWT